MAISEAEYLEFQKLAFRMKADLDGTMRSWALAETSRMFKQTKSLRYRRWCIQEQTHDPSISPSILQIGLNAWRETALGVIRLTDFNAASTFPRLRTWLRANFHAEELARHHKGFMFFAQDELFKTEYLKQLTSAFEFVLTHCYSDGGKSGPDNQCELWTLRVSLRPIRDEWLAHLEDSDPFRLSSYNKTIRRGLIIEGLLSDAIAFLVSGNAPSRRVQFRLALRNSENFWRAFDDGFMSQKWQASKRRRRG